jgi:superfamily II DNA helicase RecQ
LVLSDHVSELSQDIEDGKYRVIVANPEVLLKSGGGFEKLWKNPMFVSHIISIVWDEAHCISSWGDFRPEYKEAGRLRYLLPCHIPYYVVSATLPSPILSDVMTTLQMQASKTVFV